MLHSFRHYVEISLKDLIRMYAGLSDKSIRKRLEYTHNLMKLWNELHRHCGKELLKCADDEQTEENVKRCIKELNSIDDTSQTFRYATDKEGRSINDRVPNVDLEQLMQTMARLRCYFGDLDTYVQVLADRIADELESMPDEFGK